MATALTPGFDYSTNPTYEVRVRGKMYLWGSAGITEDITFPTPLVLHVRNDIFGESITLGSRSANSGETQFGGIAPGECVSVPVQNLAGVFAQCETESTVFCLVATFK